MNRVLQRIPVALKTALHLGPSQIYWYAVYQAGLRSGFFRRKSPPGQYSLLSIPIKSPFQLPDRSRLAHMLASQLELSADLLSEADEITAGQVRLFGGAVQALELQPAHASLHWMEYEGSPQAAGVEDLKLVWEPARFGWVYPLGRAYHLTGSEHYPEAFWKFLDLFCQANPPNLGPNWSSAQEVALRLLALLFAASAFEQSPLSTPARCAQLAGVIAAHAQRIPLTLSYARAQNNNHLITEALGLFAAGSALPDAPLASTWKKMGWRWLNHAFQVQIQQSGIYAQHSMNYHRLILHAALQALLPGAPFPALTTRRLAAATEWLLAQVDPASGHAPNLGSNDGAHILPLAPGGFSDYRPVGQAAARAFLNQPAFPPGPWDELGLWLGQDLSPRQPIPPLPPAGPVYRLGDPSSWATLRAVRFRQRPSHADQLHVDLWWKGENIARDSGTFRYTAPPPWDNALAQTAVHNSVTVNNQNQMLRAGRFLWLDWAQAKLLNTRRFQVETLAAQHNGYAHLGIIHRRALKRVDSTHWQVADYLLSASTLRLDLSPGKEFPFMLHWLLPDWPWSLEDSTLALTHPGGGNVQLSLSPSTVDLSFPRPPTLALVRAGKALIGPKNISPVFGWFSPTYNQREPALSFLLVVHSQLPLTLISDWALEEV